MNGLLPEFEPLAMQSRNDCGPVAMLQLLRHARQSSSPLMEYEDLLRVWRFDLSRSGVDADRLDTPGHHLRVLGRLGMRSAFRRRLGREQISESLERGFPVALLLPVGLARWHWVVACGRDREFVLVSGGDGTPVLVPWQAFDHARLCHAVSRALGIEGLGYVVGLPGSGRSLPFQGSSEIEKGILRLAGVVEELLIPVSQASTAAVRSARALRLRGFGAKNRLEATRV